jgi:hypothetical protein
VVTLSREDAEELDVRSGERVRLCYNSKEMTAIVNTMRSVPKGTVGIYDEIFKTWHIPENRIIEVQNTSLKESMYTHARFLDITEGKAGLFEKEMLVSNTRVSQEALKYALCIGQEVLSWRYPPEEGLERLIEQKGRYPITILKLSTQELASFAKIGFMVAKSLLETNASEISSRTGISLERISRLQDLTRRILL